MTVHYDNIAAQAVAARSVAAQAAAPAALPADVLRGAYARAGKRLLDVVLVLAAAPFILPVILGLMLLAAADGGRPLYVQDRVGLGGRTFRLWKLRTMKADAERLLADLCAADPAARAEWAETQKLRHDPRITRFGGILRRTSLDELPQLWNVLMGDMSLVGPRPMMTSQRDLYPGRSYFALRPGITGPWQVSDRNATSFAARARYDDAYLREMSLATDLRLLAATVRTVLRGTGC